MGRRSETVTKGEKLTYIREELKRFRGEAERFKSVRYACTESEWIALKLSCSVAEAERLIRLATGSH